MKGIMKDFLLFIVGIFVVLIIISTVFGRGIAYNILGFVSELEPSYLQEQLRTIFTVATYTPGEFEAKIEITSKHTITLHDDPYPTVLVETPSLLKFSETPAIPMPFLSNCGIVRTCTKECGFIGDSCTVPSDCCSELGCDSKKECKSNYCGDNMIQSVEECDGTSDIACPGQCQDDCMCSSIPQCRDGKDNDGDSLNDTDDPGCHTDGIATNPTSYDANDNDETDGVACRNDVREGLEMCDGTDDAACPGECRYDCTCPGPNNKGQVCTTDAECWALLRCLSKVTFDKFGGSLIIRKFYENNICKIKIEGMT